MPAMGSSTVRVCSSKARCASSLPIGSPLKCWPKSFALRAWQTTLVVAWLPLVWTQLARALLDVGSGDACD